MKSRVLFCLLLCASAVACSGQMRLTPLSHEGMSVAGWIEKEMQEDAARGWAITCNRMSHEGLLGWDANTLVPIPYYMPWSKVVGKGPKGWSRSVPYYQTIIEPPSSFGEGEFEGHWLDAVARLGWIANNESFRKLAIQAANDIIETRDDKTGYIGVDVRWIRFTGLHITPWGQRDGSFEIGGIFSILEGLLTQYRFTHDEKLLAAVLKAADLTMEKTAGREFKDTAGGLAPLGLLALYRATNRKEFLDRAAMLTNHDYEQMFGAQMSREGTELHAHSASTGILLLEMLGVYQGTGDREILNKALRLNDRVIRYAMQVQGVPAGHDEQLAAAGPGVNTEGCDIAWFTWAWLEMLKATGDAHYGDLVERAALNALPGHRSKDGAVSPYFARPNQLFAVRGSGMGTVYGARVFVECCHGNVGRILPVIAEAQVMMDREGGFTIPFYATSRYRGATPDAGAVEIAQETDYPFSDTVRIQVKAQRPAAFPVRLRVPAWCKMPKVWVNGQETQPKVRESWIELNRTWTSESRIELVLPMEVRLETNQGGLFTLARGPLVFALPIQGVRRSVDRWGSFEELVNGESQWNYALAVDRTNPAKSVTVRSATVPAEANLWERPRITLEVEAVRVPEWKFPKPVEDMAPQLSTEIPEPPAPAAIVRVAGPRQKVQLVPYGCTILRMTQLPLIE